VNIVINNKEVEVREGETLIEVAERAGYPIPHLCYSKGAQHKSSCMVCAVKDCATDQIIPSCSTLPTEGMKIDTESPDIKLARTLSLELLLSDHRADCEAPCSLVCPEGLDIEKMLEYYDAEKLSEAYNEISKTFQLPQIACETCKAPCEKACRRGTIDKAVAIRSIITEVVGKSRKAEGAGVIRENHSSGEEYDMSGTASSGAGEQPAKQDKNIFLSRLGRFSEEEKGLLKSTVITPSRCLHCACAGQEGCKLRLYATSESIKRSRYETSSAMSAMTRQHVSGNIWFEPAKCISCGLCVYNSKNGFTFKDRGFVMQVMLPEENAENISEQLTKLCPTGALYTK